MKLLNLNDEAITELLSLPETGMGFQFVEATFWGNIKQLLVFNSKFAVDISELKLSATDDIYELLQNERKITNYLDFEHETILSAPGPHSFKLISTRIATQTTATNKSLAATTSSLVKHVTLNSNRIFYRFSAFSPDHRVNPTTGDFLAGTYATAKSEIPFVPSGFAAVGRFALPNKIPASYRYAIEAPKGTQVSFGTVAPAFSQAGGGVEAFFVNAVENQHSPMKPAQNIPDE